MHISRSLMRRPSSLHYQINIVVSCWCFPAVIVTSSQMKRTSRWLVVFALLFSSSKCHLDMTPFDKLLTFCERHLLPWLNVLLIYQMNISRGCCRHLRMIGLISFRWHTRSNCPPRGRGVYRVMKSALIKNFGHRCVPGSRKWLFFHVTRFDRLRKRKSGCSHCRLWKADREYIGLMFRHMERHD